MGDGIGDFAFGLSIGAIGLGLLIGPVGRAVASWIESRIVRRPQEMSPEIDARLSELEGMTQRLLELEERLDFAERMLARGRPTAPEVDTPPEPLEAGR